MLNKTIGFLLLVVFSGSLGYAQQTESSKLSRAPNTALYTEILRADSIVFDAFNNCDSLRYKKYLADDLEFYHDIGGLSVGVKIEMEEFRDMCARGTKIRRALVSGALEVYPIGDYGALEIGTHQFFHTNNGESEKPSGSYKFIQIWQKTASGWKISRVISYGHEHMQN